MLNKTAKSRRTSVTGSLPGSLTRHFDRRGAFHRVLISTLKKARRQALMPCNLARTHALCTVILMVAVRDGSDQSEDNCLMRHLFRCMCV